MPYDKIIKLSYADVCKMMKDSYLYRPGSNIERLDFAMLAVYYPEIYDSYVHDFIKTKKQEGKLYEDTSSNYYLVNTKNNELLCYADSNGTH